LEFEKASWKLSGRRSFGFAHAAEGCVLNPVTQEPLLLQETVWVRPFKRISTDRL
jgi:hypothetical protein